MEYCPFPIENKITNKILIIKIFYIRFKIFVIFQTRFRSLYDRGRIGVESPQIVEVRFSQSGSFFLN